ncbi:hypothetical protein, conserved [Eimeria necatrix]|uniref:Phosphodiesterase n=1 Tax=Eimeria necatrix TaxID=51315 RepID=U6MMV5_9EIME|nr:hypothetical protein, conserved [Eimeria necatrix]CDJ64413.1 hypothetical protein, conserved [Eimeria necatrix]
MNALGVGSCLVAGLCHDVGHPGRNNNFFVAEMSPLSILYNDASVLENFHSSLTFRVLADPSCNLFTLLSDAEVREVRSKIIDLILATDMRTHFEFLNRFRTIRESDQFNFRRNDDDRWLAVELCIRASDIGHGALGWKQHFEWTARATTEFYLQGDEEARLGRTISPLCDRETHSQLAKSQVGFLRHVVRPLFAELHAIDDQKKPIAEMLKNLDTNCERWEELGKAEELIVFPYIVRELDAGMKGLPHYLDISILTREDGLKNPRPSSKSCKCKCYRLKKNSSSQQDDGSSLGDKALSHERSVVSLSDQAGSAEGSAEKESPGTSNSGKEQTSEAPAKEAAPSADPSQSALHLKDSAPEAKSVDEAADPKNSTEGEVENVSSLGKAVPGASVEASGVPYGGSHDETQKQSPTDNSAHDQNKVVDRAASLAEATTKPSDKTSQLRADAGEPDVGFALPPAAEDPCAANATPHKRAWSIESNDDSPVPGIDQTFFWG